jgi:ABC-2 type transport system ATP-binding protein
MTLAVEIHNLRRVFRINNEKTVAVDDINLQIEEGEIFGLLGPNGAGKTTTIRLLACLLKPTSGSARVCGYDISKEQMKIRALCGVLTENPGLYERLNAIEYLDFFGQLYDMPKSQREPKIEDILKMLGIWDQKDQLLGSFSKGMKQKINIARALIHGPRVLFLDEPTASLDPESAKVVRDYISELKEQEKRTIFICTHNLDEAEKLCDSVAIINKGKIIDSGSVDELRANITGLRVYRLQLKQMKEEYLDAVRAVTGVKDAEIRENVIEFHTAAPEGTNPEVSSAIVQSGGEIISFWEEQKTLEDVYLKIMKEEEGK